MIEIQTFVGGLITGIVLTLLISGIAIHFYKTEVKES